MIATTNENMDGYLANDAVVTEHENDTIDETLKFYFGWYSNLSRYLNKIITDDEKSFLLITFQNPSEPLLKDANQENCSAFAIEVCAT